MFWQGTVQEGIAHAVQHSKLVINFVTDGQTESRQWEDDFLTDSSISTLVADRAVLLRIQAGSDEAGYLAQIFPLPKTPTLVIISNGQLKEYLTAGITREDFLQRVQSAFLPGESASSGNDSAFGFTPAPASATPSGGLNPERDAVAAAAEPTAERQQPGQEALAHQPQHGEQAIVDVERRVAAARQQALEQAAAELRRRQQAEDERRRREAKGKMPAKEEDDEAKKAVKQASQQFADRQRQAREDRKRVLQRIEDDKAERRAREEERRAERTASLEGQHADGSLPTSSLATGGGRGSTGARSETCNLQVRLFDGSTIRTRLPSSSKLQVEVRKWIDQTRQDGNDPYEFKVVLTPQPNRTIDATEETETLEGLGLTPSATLILKPVSRFSSAYAGTGDNAASRVLVPVFGFFAWIVGIFTGFFGALFSGSGPAQPAPEEIPLQDYPRRDGNRVRGLRDGDDRSRDQQLYNGNSLNFEPRNNDDDER